MSGARERYTHGHSPVVVAAHARRTAEEAAAFVTPRIPVGSHVLDFGCGPGSITIGLADHVGSEGTVVGIDNSPAAIALAAKAGSKRPNLHFQTESVYELPFPDARFDVAYGHQVMQHLADPVAALREIKRVLKPDGLIAVRDSDYASMTHHPSYPEIEEWLELYRAVARANGGEPDAGRRLLQWVNEADFADPVATTSTWTFATASERSEWAQLWADRIQLPYFTSRAVELGLASAEDIERMSEAWLQWAAEADGWFSFIHGEVVAVKPGA
ncbi:MAG: methyltransferase domain-containing protein [Acidimicrobiia bacterium]|nr:methyltransferase domain-containing protein [Acidimicrobiia bacterium]